MTAIHPDLASALIDITLAVDRGDVDNLLLAEWADILEEIGDPRAAGMRLVGEHQPYRVFRGNWQTPAVEWQWHEKSRYEKVRMWTQLSPHIFAALKGGEVRDAKVTRRRVERRRGYPTRSAAFLALAAALMQE